MWIRRSSRPPNFLPNRSAKGLQIQAKTVLTVDNFLGKNYGFRDRHSKSDRLQPSLCAGNNCPWRFGSWCYCQLLPVLDAATGRRVWANAGFFTACDAVLSEEPNAPRACAVAMLGPAALAR